jgi:hypothetical protein
MTRAAAPSVAAYSDRNPLDRIADLHFPDQDWRLYAACAGTGWPTFFVEIGGSAKEAKQICARCDVRDQCLDYVLGEDDINHGIWGGVGPTEYRKLRRERNKDGKPATVRSVICQHCHHEFQATNPRAIYCSPNCRKAASRRKVALS